MPDLTFDPGIPSAELHIVGGGLGLLCKEQGLFLGLMRCGDLGVGLLKPKAIGVDLSFQAALYEDRTVSAIATRPSMEPTRPHCIPAVCRFE